MKKTYSSTLRGAALVAGLACFAPACLAAGQTLNLGAMDSQSADKSDQKPAKTAPPADQCASKESDLSNLGAAIDQIQDGKSPGQPLAFSAKRLLTMNPAILAKLKSHYVVLDADCQAVPVIDGQLAQTVTVDFSALAHQVVSAIRNGNKDRLKFLVESFQAAPLQGAEGIQLIHPVPYSPDTQKKLTSVLGVQPSEYDNQEKAILMSALYTRLGGKVNDPVPVQLWVGHIYIPAGTEKDGKTTWVEVSKGGVDDRSFLAALNKLGYAVIDAQESPSS